VIGAETVRWVVIGIGATVTLASARRYWWGA